MDDAFAARMGLENLDKLKDALRGQLDQQYAAQSRFRLKRHLLDVLDERHSFILPEKMVENEFNSIWAQVEADKARGNLPPEDQGKSDEDLRKEYRDIAERRVRLGLVLAEVGRRGGVTVTDQELSAAVMNEARAIRAARRTSSILPHQPQRRRPAARAGVRREGLRLAVRRGQGDRRRGLQGRALRRRRPAAAPKDEKRAKKAKSEKAETGEDKAEAKSEAKPKAEKKAAAKDDVKADAKPKAAKKAPAKKD